jgi:UDP-glucuronate 4-epimerase
MSAHAHDTLSPAAPWRVVNIAGGAPKPLAEFIAALEFALGRTAIKTLLPMQAGDVSATEADVSLLRALIGQAPATSITQGVAAVVDWYRTDYSRLQT